MSWLDPLFAALRVKSAGALVPTRSAINFTGSGVTVTDDQTNNATTVAIASAALVTTGSVAPVRVATTANITLSGTQTIDGASVIVGDRVLVKNQTSAADNGPYVVASGSWSRAADANTSALVVSYMTVAVQQGTQRGTWILTTPAPITLGATALTFVKLGSTVDVSLFGAKGDGVYLTGLTIAASASTLTIAGLSSADVGKLILIDGAGTAGGTHRTTISNVSGTTVTLAAAAATTATSVRGCYGTDDSGAVTTALSAIGKFRTLHFPTGVYCLSTGIVVTGIGTRLTGTGEGGGNTAGAGSPNVPVSELRFFGTGDAVFFDGGATGSNGSLVGCALEDLSIAGTSACTNLLRLRNCHHGRFSRYRGKDCSGAATKTEFAISDIFDHPRCSSNEDTFLAGATPLWGMDLGARLASEGTTSCKITCPVFEGLQNGIKDGLYNNSNNFEGGTSEGMSGTALLCSGTVNGVYSGMDLEANVTADIQVDGGCFGLTFLGMQATSAVTGGGIYFKNTGLPPYMCSVIGGALYNAKTDSGCANIHFGNPQINNTATLVAGTWFGVYNSNISGFAPWTAPNAGLSVPANGAAIVGGTTSDTLHVTGDTRSDGVFRGVGDVVPSSAAQAIQVVDQIGSPSTQRQLAIDLDSTDTFGGSTIGVGYVEYVKQGVGYGPLRLNPGGGGVGIGSGSGIVQAVNQGSFTFSPGAPLAAGASNNTTATINGATLGDRVTVAPTTYPGFGGWQATAYVTSSNTVLLEVTNVGLVPQTWASITWKVDVWR